MKDCMLIWIYITPDVRHYVFNWMVIKIIVQVIRIITGVCVDYGIGIANRKVKNTGMLL